MEFPFFMIIVAGTVTTTLNIHCTLWRAFVDGLIDKDEN